MQRFRFLLATVLCFTWAAPSFGGIVISGYMANPASTDSPFEYIQLLATSAIDFATTSYSVVVANNGTATSSGWASGGSLSYEFDLTSGSVAKGDVFYVGGSGKTINGSGSTDISSAAWIRTINTGTTAGDSGRGISNSAGVVGNGGSNADGIAVFSLLNPTSSTVPIDAIFYGTAVGTAKPATGGYQVPTNDLYAGGIYGSTGNTFAANDPGSGQYTKLTGTFNPSTDAWTVARIPSLVSSPTQLSDIASAITLAAVPEGSAFLFVGLVCCMAGIRYCGRHTASSVKS